MQRLIKLALLLSSLICYLEWPANNSCFLYEIEFSLLSFPKDAASEMHPLIVTPLIGQFLIIFSMFIRQPARRLTIIGIILNAILVLFILFVGIYAGNLKIIVSTIPFILISVFYIARRTS